MVTREDIVESIKIELGYPVITVNITDEQILTLIDKAVRKCQSKACPFFTALRSISSGKIDLTGLDVEAVHNVYADLSSPGAVNIFDPQYIQSYGMYNPSNQRFLDSLAIVGTQAEMRKLQLQDYYQDGDSLYVDDYEGTVTIEYTKKKITFEDLDSEWAGWVESYAAACVKIAEGRIRGKYKSSAGVYEVESDNLISEGTSEKSELESRLDNSLGYYNILK